MVGKILTFIVLSFLLNLPSWADNYVDLKKYAREVPVRKVSAEATEYIENETNESVTGIISHYTLALFEDVKSGRTWYILDGYYQLKSGRVLFLDFVYRPREKTWWPIENYKYYLSRSMERFMLESKNICNPHERHLIGVISSYLSNVDLLGPLTKFFKNLYSSQPIFIYDNGNTLIIDPTKSSSMGGQVMFTLAERSVISALKQKLNIDGKVLLSGRSSSNGSVKKTYVGVTSSCRK